MPNLRRASICLLAAALCAALHLLALHPGTGATGGLLYLLVGWALPSLCVIALALAAAFLLPIGRAAQMAAAFVLSIPLGLNTALPRMVDAATYSPDVSSRVERMVEWGTDARWNFANVKRRSWGSVFTDPFGARVRVSGDEGCGCFYFLDAADALYSDRMIATLFSVVGKRGAIVDYGHPGVETREENTVFADLSLRKRDGRLHALVDVHDRGRTIASFRHSGIPLAALVERDGLGRGNLSNAFWSNARDLLLHDNLWSAAANYLMPSYFPEKELRAFFQKAGLSSGAGTGN